MIFCHCAVVSDRDVSEAIDAGARTVAQVCRATGAGQQCGNCIFSVRRVVCEHVAAHVEASANAPEVGFATG